MGLRGSKKSGSAIHGPRYRTHNGRTQIDLYLRHIEQLFDSLDPSPFLERDLDEKAADYIISAAQEHSPSTPLALTISISSPEEFKMEPDVVKEAIHEYFHYNAELARKKLRQVFRQGRFSLLVGVIALFVSLTVSQSIKPLAEAHTYIGVIREGLMIMGWVAMWRPIEIFLYSWRPQVEMRRTFQKLSTIPVEIRLLH